MERGIEPDPRLKDIYIISGKPMHIDVIVQTAKQPPEGSASQESEGGAVTPPSPLEQAMSRLSTGIEDNNRLQRKALVAGKPVLIPQGYFDAETVEVGKSVVGEVEYPPVPAAYQSFLKDFVSDKQRRFFFAMFGDMVDEPDWGFGINRSLTEKGGYTDFGSFHSSAIPLSEFRAYEEKARQISYKHTANLTDGERAAIRIYSGQDYRQINSALREGRVPESYSDVVDELDRAIQKTTLDSGLVTYRGMRLSPSDVERLKPGGRIRHKGYISTSLSEREAASFTRGNVDREAVLLRIKVPKGSNALAIDTVSINRGEREVVLPRGSEMIITRVTKRGRATYIDAKILKRSSDD
jgi:hypothetical protein